jgi:hypothetical protein
VPAQEACAVQSSSVTNLPLHVAVSERLLGSVLWAISQHLHALTTLQLRGSKFIPAAVEQLTSLRCLHHTDICLSE